jgi:Tol biopolymer transport system component
VSVDSAGNEADRISSGATISGDGRFVAFSSWASKLVLHDTNGVYDIFVHDRDPDGNGVFDEGNGVTTRVSVDSNGTQGDGHSFNAAISADGTRVAFQSESDDLVPGDGNGQMDIFVRLHHRHDRPRERRLDGRRGRQLSFSRPLGRWTGRRLRILRDEPSRRRHERQRRLPARPPPGATTRVSVDSSGVGGTQMSFTTSWSLSADGTRVAFVSAAPNLVSDDTNSRFDAFVHDTTTGTTVRASLGQGDVQSDADVWFVAISGDGNGVVFITLADDLVPPDGNGVEDAFFRDLAHGTTELVSRDFAARSGDGPCLQGSLNADGSLVAFDSSRELRRRRRQRLGRHLRPRRTIAPVQASSTNYGAGSRARSACRG